MKLNDIYEDFGVEDNVYECKARLDRNNILGWLKTIDGFANTKGGDLFLGVEDKTNKLIGFDAEEIDKEKHYLYNTIQEHFETMPNIESKLLGYVINEKKRYIIQIKVYESLVKPVILKYQGMPMIFMRRDGYTQPATTEEIILMSKNSKSIKYDTDYTNVKFKSSDFSMLFSFYKENTGIELKEKELAAIGFYNENVMLSRGAMLFKDDYVGDNTNIVCSLYKGFTRGDDQIIASNSFNGNLISSYKYIWEFVNLRMNHSLIKKETTRLDLDAFPKRSLFEAIINSLAHRDYFITGSAIYVDLFKNRLVISSPGGFYGSGELKRTYKLDSFISRRRNELICNVFILCKAMEAKGTGFEKIMSDYSGEDIGHQPFIFAKNNQFSIVLPDLTYSMGVSLNEDSIRYNVNNQSSSKHDLAILAFCYNQNKTVKEIVDNIKVSDSTFFRKNILGNLVKQGFLIEESNGKKKTYITNHNLVERY